MVGELPGDFLVALADVDGWLIGVVSSWVTSAASDTRPRYWWRRLTTKR